MSASRSLALGAALFGLTASAAGAATPVVTGHVDDKIVVALAGSQASALASATDRGVLAFSHVFPHLMMGLRRPVASQAALDRLVAAQQTPGSPDYHHWIRAADLRHYGPAPADIAKVVGWLRSEGLVVNSVSPSGMSIDFSGNAGQVANAFHTSMHAYTRNGEAHVASATDPSIPAALAPVVDGVTLANFFPRPQLVPKSNFTVPTGPGNLPFYAVVPADFYDIYNLDPVFAGGIVANGPIDGTGVTIAVVEQTDILSSDYVRFRSAFELPFSKLSTLHPGGCTDPGRTSDEVEAALDAEWAGSTAPNAYVVEASCAATETTFGVMTTLQKLIETTDTDATIYSISYGGCEQQDGLAFLDMWADLAEEGAAKGISIVVSAGDSGSSCDRSTVDGSGLGVNGLSANRYVTSVGGTDFLDTALGELSTYWSKANSQNGRSSALSYIPEIPWNNSCASSVIASYNHLPSGLDYCNTGNTPGVQDGVGGTGGASLFYGKPSFQSASLPGMPDDGVRDQPDVSLFAANGYWDHAYLICMSDANEGGYPCQYVGNTNGTPNALFQAYGGTSIAAPAFAGILALETELAQAPLGNPNRRLYQLAGLQFSNPVLIKSCNASLGRQISKGCIFNNVTAGDNSQPCYAGTADCHTTASSKGAGLGVLSQRDGQSNVPAFQARAGYSLATGLGSINVTNLLLNY